VGDTLLVGPAKPRPKPFHLFLFHPTGTDPKEGGCFFVEGQRPPKRFNHKNGFSWPPNGARGVAPKNFVRTGQTVPKPPRDNTRHWQGVAHKNPTGPGGGKGCFPTPRVKTKKKNNTSATRDRGETPPLLGRAPKNRGSKANGSSTHPNNGVWVFFVCCPTGPPPRSKRGGGFPIQTFLPHKTRGSSQKKKEQCRLFWPTKREPPNPRLLKRKIPHPPGNLFFLPAKQPQTKKMKYVLGNGVLNTPGWGFPKVGPNGPPPGGGPFGIFRGGETRKGLIPGTKCLEVPPLHKVPLQKKGQGHPFNREKPQTPTPPNQNNCCYKNKVPSQKAPNPPFQVKCPLGGGGQHKPKNNPHKKRRGGSPPGRHRAGRGGKLGNGGGAQAPGFKKQRPPPAKNA